MKKAQIAPSDGRIADAINIRNIHNVSVFSLVVCIVESISLILYVLINRNAPELMRTLMSVSFCVVVCGIVAILSQVIERKHKRDGIISNIQANALVMSFYVLMSAWSIIVDTAHYSDGDQMLTFYIVQLCFVSFVVMLPKIGSALIALTFSALYIALYFQDGAAHIQQLNLLIFTIIAVFGNVMQNMLLRKSEKSKIEIHELNQLLQQEASIDDLTQLKNRKALREDFSKYIGRTATVLMVDIDHFKSFNDIHGHVIGDTVLRVVAAATKEAFQGGEAYRYGGDEFLVIFPDCTEEAFDQKKKQWQEAIRAIRIPDVIHTISCSSGSERLDLRSEEDLRRAIITADDRLYHAKESR